MATSPAISASPAGSCTISRSGGRSQPVAQGDSARAIQPDGAIRNAMPKAAAACGTASSGESSRRTASKAPVPCSDASTSTTRPSERTAETSPVTTLRRAASMKPGQARRSRNAPKPGRSAPMAGSQPKAGPNAPSSPATTGPSIASTVRAGTSGRSLRRGARALTAAPKTYRATP